jgi:tetratricopeptide (TPR) repeat protein
LKITRERGDQVGEANTLLRLGQACHATDAAKLYEQVLPLLREVGRRSDDPPSAGNSHEPLGSQDMRITEAAALNELGTAYLRTQDIPRAIDTLKQALSLAVKFGRRDIEGASLTNIGSAYCSAGDHSNALDCLNRALPIHKDLANRSFEANTLTGLADVYAAMGEHDRALEYYEIALPVHREARNRRGEFNTLNNSGKVHATRNDSADWKKAQASFEQALAVMRAGDDPTVDVATLNSLRDPANKTTVLKNLGAACLTNGDNRRARECLE